MFVGDIVHNQIMGSAKAVNSSTGHILINKPSHFSFNECLWFLDRNLDDCMHQVQHKQVRKLLRLNRKLILIEVSEKGKHLQVTLPASKTSLTTFRKEIITYVHEWFDLDRDIGPFYRLLEKDKELKPLGKAYYGLRLVGIPDLFELLCWCVIGQQINLDFAYKVKRRLVEQYGPKIKFEGALYYTFPEPSALARLKIEDLRKLQLTTRKSEYIIGIARLFEKGEMSRTSLLSLKNEEAMKNALTQIRGIGEWTANYTVMKGLGGMNCIPYGDSGVNNALLKLKGIPKKNNRPMVDAVFEQFKDWQSYLVYYLWRYLRNPA